MVATVVVERDWELFRDWCLSKHAEPSSVTRTIFDEFTADVPGSDFLQLRRMRSVRHTLAAAGVDSGLGGGPEPSTTLRTGEGWVEIPRALAQLPTLRSVGLRGRRDGWLLVLIGVLGMTRRQASNVAEGDVELFPELAVAGLPVPCSADAGECPACAVYRWLRVLGPAAAGDRADVGRVLDPRGADTSVHDCRVALDGTWRAAATMIPAIDRHGWLDMGGPISLVAISAIMAVRQRVAGMPERGAPLAFEYNGRFKDSTSAELADAYDDVDAQVAALLARSAEILGDGAGLLEHLHSFGLED